MTAMETIDILTPDGEYTGRVEPRTVVHSLGLWHRTVHIWIVNDDRDILLQKRALIKQTHPGLWDVSCAGHISAGETSLDAARKELREELGLALSPAELMYLFTEQVETLHDQGRYIDREFHDIYLVRKNVPLTDLTIQASEVAALMYLPLRDFGIKIFRKDKSLVPHFREYTRIQDCLNAL
jgi:isopentenyldiphosphate isomerase